MAFITVRPSCAYFPDNMETEQLITLFSNLHDPHNRVQVTNELAQLFGGQQLQIFGKDNGINGYLPALGLPQTLQQGRFWLNFVNQCVSDSSKIHTADLNHTFIQGIADNHGHAVLVLVGGHLPDNMIKLITPLLRALGWKLVEERLLQVMQSDMLTAQKTVQHADALNKTLNLSRNQLHEAYLRVEAELEQRRRAEAKLTVATEFSETIMLYSLDVIGLYAHDGQILQISNAATQIWGYPVEEIIGRSLTDFILAEDITKCRSALIKLARGEAVINFENRHICKDGTEVNMLWNAKAFGEDKRIIALGRDITAIRLTLKKLEESEQRFRSLFEHHTDAVFSRDLEGRFIEGNRALWRLTQYTSTELEQLNTQFLAANEEQHRIRAHFRLARSGIPQNFRTAITRKDGSTIEVDLAYIPTIVKQHVVGVFGIMRDITESANYERHIAYLASHDALTGLPNRNLLDERLSHSIEQRHAHQFGILFLDLNRFKLVNDSLGHDKGDLLLQMTADRLRKAVREGDTVARLGGDEFVVILEDIESSDRMAQVANELLAAVAQPFHLGGHELTISTSIGGSVYPKDGHDAATLLKHADLAMYQAKELGSGTFRFFNPAMNVKMLERLLTETSLKRALERNELILHYQPRMDVRNATAIGVEALVRWMQPERGMIAPEDFIPLAEEIGMIGAVGEWVLETACRQNRLWQDMGKLPIKMSVNLSAHQLREAGFADTLQRILTETGLAPRWLELEITETSLMQNLETSFNILQEIRDIGVSISIDDFGTGYSSLAYLKKLPIDTLKIDKSFIHDVIDDADDATIVSATISLAHNMGLQVVAEGVTTYAQMHFLLEHKCHAMQGFLFSRPLPAPEITAKLSDA